MHYNCLELSKFKDPKMLDLQTKSAISWSGTNSDILSLLIFNPQVSHHNRRTRKIVTLAYDFKPNAVSCPLHISPGLS